MRHTLPSGAWVEVRDPMEITHGQWLDAIEAIPEKSTADDLAMAVSITGWSYEMPPPTCKDLSSIRDVPQADVAALGERLLSVLRLCHPSFAVSVDPESPTESSDA